ncbi:tail fiber protein, partial [Ursidibacter arcticus]
MKLKLADIFSNTGKFIDGNPATGQQGTIVTAKWLNDVQERVQDTFEELKNVLALGNLQPNPQSQTQVAEAIRAYVASQHASTTKKGIVQLNNTLTSTSQEQALTAAQGKVLNDKITQNEQKTLELTNQKVNKTDVSDSVSSNSQTTVGSSRAVKTAYDKGVEAKNAADNAKNAASAAQRTANAKQSPATTLAGYGITDGVNKAGDEMGWLRVVNDTAVLSLKSRNRASAYIDFSIWNGSHPHSTIECIDVGNWSTEFRFHTTPQGENYNSDRRHHVA